MEWSKMNISGSTGSRIYLSGVDSIKSISINGLESKFSYNTSTKILKLMGFTLESSDNCIITYYSIAEERDKKLNKLGI